MKRILPLFLCLGLLAQSSKVNQTGGEIVANPNRPTVADPADITQYGVLEVEYGWERSWSSGRVREGTVDALHKFALFHDFELRWEPTWFSSLDDRGGYRRGLGDIRLGWQYRFLKQTAHRPALAFGYNVKFPSAVREEGLGSGRYDHDFKFLASKDVGRGFHFDANAALLVAGREGRPGHDRAAELTVSFSHRIKGPWAFNGEFYGDTRLNADTPGFASTLWAVIYTVSPRLVLDAGMDFGLTPGTPRKHVFAGVTYSIADLYASMKRRRASRP